jgi:hypothetical protein
LVGCVLPSLLVQLLLLHFRKHCPHTPAALCYSRQTSSYIKLRAET